MKLLWITNLPIGKLIDLEGSAGVHTTGTWLSAALATFIGDGAIELAIVTVGNSRKIKSTTEGNITYCILPGGLPGRYNHLRPKNAEHWEFVKRNFQPDIIHIWGTECTHGYLALKTMPEIPAVLYMQGLLESISRYYLAGMNRRELLNSVSLRNVLRLDWITRRQKSYAKKAQVEAEMIKIARNVIVANRWCATHCHSIDANCVVYQCQLPIDDAFLKTKWIKENIEPFTIMCNATGYPIKGLHVLIKALSVIVRRFPNTKLLIPGRMDNGKKLFEKITEDGYIKFIRELIRKRDMSGRVIFMGPLTPEQMAKRMATINVFAMPSSIENHSSTLIEAMVVGVPCVASYVGGIPEAITHGENGLLYRFEEYEMLAEFICDVFSDIDYAAKLGNKASLSTREKIATENIKERLISIYAKISNMGQNATSVL